ncbi:multicopper oxidase family protein [Streptomyces orinoci]|uniref:Multicopper oxidase family protein n=1 Tax=Streptomyces orinoci TaxID=67339 RepID=A0ABV3JVJ6_STRON|nr:multicopper oxidase family protein [Streptomyces orinoci]
MRTITRRALLGAAIGTATSGLLAACSRDRGPAYVAPDGKEVAAAEARRRGSGTVRRVRLTAGPARLDLGGTTVETWAYGGALPGEEIRVTAGDTLAATLTNQLPQATSLHWHGLALRNDMDGVPGVTGPAVTAGQSFTYRFTTARPGTYWFHPHSGVQQDRGLYAPLIVEDPHEPLSYDKEWVVVLDDWVDGVEGSTPDSVLTELSKGMGMGMGMADGDGKGMDHGTPGMHGMHRTHQTHPAHRMLQAMAAPGGGGPSRMLMGATSAVLGGDAGDVAYPHYLVNGRTPQAPRTFAAKPGDRIRIRLVNAGGDTAFRVALGGHRMTVTHTDGFPVEHTATDSLLLGMGERYDVLVTAGDGVFPLTALAEGKGRTALALLRTGGGTAPGADVRPRELGGEPLTAGRLRADRTVTLPRREPDRTLTLRLTGSMAGYDWRINGERYDPDRRLPVKAGERVRLVFDNRTTMWHPMHLHGHTFALPGGGPRKDTAIVLPGRRLAVDFDADNPGLWMAHCHNVYHSESGMMTVLGYRA